MFKNNYKRRILLFNYLVKSILLYGSEIWGWQEHPKVEAVQLRYLKWTLEADIVTPGYVVTRETNADKIRIDSGKRASKYEIKIRKKTENIILKECMKEIDGKKIETRWAEHRKLYYERNGLREREAVRKIRNGENLVKELVTRDKETQQQIESNKIDTSRYTKNYKKITPREEIAAYLAEEECKYSTVLARFRMGNEEKGNQFWKREEERICKICQLEQENIEHWKTSCKTEIRNENTVEKLLDEHGENIGWLRRVWVMRRKD